MHDRKILHRDLKPENMLFDEKYQMKLCDFGTAIDTNIDVAGTFLGSAYYVSPEVMTTKIATMASDYWAVGCILYEMLVGGKMFKGRSEYYIMQQISACTYNKIPEDSTNTSSSISKYKTIIENLCNHDQNLRTKAFQEINKNFEHQKYQPNFENFKFEAYSPLGDFSGDTEPFVFESFADILNVDDLLQDVTDEIKKHEFDVNFVDISSYRKNVEPPKSSKYYGLEVAKYFEGKVVDETVVASSSALNYPKLLQEQHKLNKWSSYLDKDELILLQGELFVRSGYERKVLETNLDPPAKPQMFIYILNTQTKQKSILGCIDDKVKFKIPIDNKTRVEVLNNKIFVVLKQYPERCWYFEISNEDDEINEKEGQYLANSISEEDIEADGICSDLWKRLLTSNIQ